MLFVGIDFGEHGGMGKQYPTGYPSDVSDEEWAFVAPYLALCREDAPQREHSLRAVFNGLRYIVRTGNQWRFMPHDLPPWQVVYNQTQRWMRAGCFETIVEDVRSLLREFAGRKRQPTAMILDSRTLQSTPESGARGGYDGAKRRKGIEGACGGGYAGPSACLTCHRGR
jgi:transposase